MYGRKLKTIGALNYLVTYAREHFSTCVLIQQGTYLAWEKEFALALSQLVIDTSTYCIISNQKYQKNTYNIYCRQFEALMVFIQCLQTPLGIVLFQIIGTGKYLQYLSQVLKDLIQYLQTHLGIVLFNSQVLESTYSIYHRQFEAPMVFMQVGNIGSSCMKHLNQLHNHLFYKKSYLFPSKLYFFAIFKKYI